MDEIDREAKARGVSRATMLAYYQRQSEMRGQNGTGGWPGATPKPAAKPAPKRSNQSAYQRIISALSK